MTTFGCIICGFEISDASSPELPVWSSEYRAIYSDPLGTTVTGVGCYIGSAVWTAPSDPAKKWDDSDHDPQEEEEIPVMWQKPANGRHGFVLHDACWRLTVEFFKPNRVPIRRLVEICESLPILMQWLGLCWGHSYGDLLTQDTKNHFPWEEWFVPPTEQTEILELALNDPFDIPENRLLPGICNAQPVEWNPINLLPDCFSLLPWEILDHIAASLSTTDALRLRLVSTSFQPLLWSGTFWASRFKAGGERDFVFEKQDPGGKTNWLSLYRQTNPAACSPGLRNRRRIWTLIRSMSFITNLRLTDTPTLSPNSAVHSAEWIRISGVTRLRPPNEPWQRFEEGSCIRGLQVISVPENLSKIAFSLIDSGELGYVTGIRFITSTGSDVSAGFFHEHDEVTHDVKELKGFKTAVCQRGIRAVQIVHRDGTLSEWFGYPQWSPVSDRLAELNAVGEIEVGFDGYKIVQLGARGQAPSSSQICKLAPMTLRQAALWYSVVPNKGLCLNENSYPGGNPCSIRYRPLFWNHFGGASGCRLRHITGLSILYSTTAETFYGLKFHYVGEDFTRQREKLGCRDSLCEDSALIPTFAIDGPVGELIDSVEIGIKRWENRTFSEDYDFLKFGMLMSFKVATNWNRSCMVGDSSDQYHVHKFVIAEGTTITGFYAIQQVGYGITSLGVVSEIAQDEKPLNG